jgi:hypothetical protein
MMKTFKTRDGIGSKAVSQQTEYGFDQKMVTPTVSDDTG